MNTIKMIVFSKLMKEQISNGNSNNRINITVQITTTITIIIILTNESAIINYTVSECCCCNLHINKE